MAAILGKSTVVLLAYLGRGFYNFWLMHGEERIYRLDSSN